jgi:hypothetical protein
MPPELLGSSWYLLCQCCESLPLPLDVADEQVAGNQAGLSAEYMTKMSVAFFLIRCAYSK